MHELLFFIVGIPLLLVVIYMLPYELKDAYFILHTKAPNIASMFLSNYTHSEWGHFSANVLIYIITMALVLLLETDKATFYRTMAFLFLPLPFILSFATLLFVPVPNSQGVSGIVAGIIGYLAYVVYGYVKGPLKVDTQDVPFILMIFSINAAASAVGNGLFKNPLAGLFFIGAALILLYINRLAITMLLARLYGLFSKAGLYGKVEGASVGILIVLLLLSLPLLINITTGNDGTSVANVIAHYAGYVCGMLFPLFLSHSPLPNRIKTK